MPTSTKVRKLTDSKLDTEARLQLLTNKVIAQLVAIENRSRWDSADHIQVLSVGHNLLGPKIDKILTEAFCIAYGIPLDGNYSKHPKYDSFSTVKRRLLMVGLLPKKLYDEYRVSGRSFTDVWSEVAGDRGRRVLKKDAKKAMEDAHRTVLERRAKKGDVEAQKELEAMPTNSDKPKSNTTNRSSGDYAFDEWKELKGKVRYYIKNEPKKFYNFILALSNEEILNSGWGRLAKREIELIDTGV